MSSEEPAAQSLGDQLYSAGWRQGALFTSGEIHFHWNEVSESGATLIHDSRAARSREHCILITQTYDVVSDKELFVEALVCKVERNQRFLQGVDRNSARWFVVDPDKGLVAQAMYRVVLSKAALTLMRPEPWPSTDERLDRFVRWLARRYDRPALPDAMVELFQQPVERALSILDRQHPALGAAFSRAVYELRVNLPDVEEPPFDLQLLLLVKHDGITEEEADAIDRAAGMIHASLDPALVRLSPDLRILTDEEMTVAEYFATRPLFLEYLTYRGEEIAGAEPYGTV